MALSSANESVPEESVNWLIDQQATGGDFAGSWDDGFGTAGNPDSTAMALFALMVSGQESAAPAVEAGLDFLEQAQLDTGGWEYAAGLGENANSTALVTFALTMLGEDLYSEDSRWVKDGRDPLTALLGWQGESGAFQADFGDGPFDDFFSTVQSLPTLGFIQLRVGGGPLQATVVAAPQEMTPTATTAAEEPSATPLPPTVTPEPTEIPPSPTPEEITAATEGSAAGAIDREDNAGATAQDGDDSGGNSILPWIIVAAAIILVGGLAWWLISRRREA